MSKDFFDAIKRGDVEQVKDRVQQEPGLIHAREKGLSPVLVAAYYHEPELADFLAEKTVALTIFEAAATGRTNYITLLLARNPGLVNAYAEDGFQPLGLACFFGHYEAAKYLIKAGASVNSPSGNSLHATPLQSAAAANHLQLADLLIANSADPNCRDQAGHTPLHAAAQNGNVDMLRALIYGGADLDARSLDGKLPVDVALEAGQEEAARLLMEGITRRTRARRAAS